MAQIRAILAAVIVIFVIVGLRNSANTVKGDFKEGCVIDVSKLEEQLMADVQDRNYTNVLPSCENTNNATQSPAVFLTASTYPIKPASHTTTNNTMFSVAKPIFFLSLPNSGNLALSRYFRCADIRPDQIGRYWTNWDPQSKPRVPIGQCMANNFIRSDVGMMEGCGVYKVWLEVQQLAGPQLRGKNQKPSECFDPVLHPGALEKLYESYPQGATILNLIKDPVEWYKYLPKDFPWHWADWCNTSYGFPTRDTQEAYVEFYKQYQSKLRNFVKEHPTWTYVEVDLQYSPNQIGDVLSQSLGIAPKCWTDAYTATLPKLEDPKAPPVQDHQPLPNDLRYPILVTSLPKSGTTSAHSYFHCSMGKWTTAHQQVINLTNTRLTSIGECMLHNNKHNLPLLENCGNARVYSDVGIFNTPLCYYPTLHGGLEKFAKAYPYGTILHIVRNATTWYSSANRWRGLPSRWANTRACANVFPPKHSSPETWHDWYEQHNERIRDFAKAHPTLGFLEVPLALTTGNILEDAFGFNPACWTQTNVNHGEKKRKTKGSGG